MINYLGVPVRSIVGITLGVTTAAAVIVGVAVLVVWICCKYGRRRKYKLSDGPGEGGNHEMI